MSDASRKRRSARQASHRKASLYVDPDTDDDFDVLDGQDFEPGPSAKRVRSTTSSRSRSTQLASGVDNSDTSELDDETRVTSQPRRTTRGTSAAQTSLTNRVLSRVGRKPRRHPIAWIKQRTKPVSGAETSVSTGPQVPSDGKIPRWDQLPYAVWLQIFSYAYDESDSTKWLLRSARSICRAFVEPALTAFYNRPNLLTSWHAEMLMHRADITTGSHVIDYKTKVQRLSLDTNAFVNRKDEEQSFDIGTVISGLPRLDTILITSAQDKPPYRRHAPPRWRYPDSLFRAFDLSQRQLRAWRWNWLFVRRSKTTELPRLYDLMVKYHQSPAFERLTHLEISDFPEIVGGEDEQPHQEDKIAEAIGLLPALISLELETCDIVNGRFLERLPKTLRRLRLANCEALTSDDLQVFLNRDGGCQLETLILDHNVRLDLSFLPVLKMSCTRLKVLAMDLHYYSQHHTVNDAEARYKHLIAVDDIPTWPSTLQRLELVHLQKWDAAGAQNMFGSLIEAAPDLPDLRVIILHAHISIAWRDRASFREQWIDKLRKVFLRRCKPPNPDLASMKAFRYAQMRRSGDYGATDTEHVLTTPAAADTSAHVESDQGDDAKPAEAASGRRSKRIAAVENERAAKVASQHTTTDPSVASESSSEADNEATGFVQGMCSVVDVTIDNQRPREDQYNESHFLDSEESGDEDWTEAAGEVEEDDGYAW